MSVQGSRSESSAGKKDMTWIWVLVFFLVLCLCLSLLLGGTAVYLFMLRPSGGVPLPPAQDVPTPPVVPTEARPAPPEPTAMPLEPLPETLDIEFYRPSEADDYYALIDYVPDYEGQTAPGEQFWLLELNSRETVVVDTGWCTIDRATLEQNYAHIQFSFMADDLPVDMEQIFTYDQELSDRICKIHSGIVRAWPPGDHIITITMSILQPINDGWDDYPAGDYTDTFIITASP